MGFSSKLSAILEALNRRDFMRQSGGTILSTLLSKGVPEQLARTFAAAPAQHAGYLNISLLDSSYGVDADWALTGAEGLTHLMDKIGATKIGLMYSGDEVLLPVTGEQYARFLGLQQEEDDEHYMVLDTGWAIGHNFESLKS